MSLTMEQLVQAAHRLVDEGRVLEITDARVFVVHARDGSVPLVVVPPAVRPESAWCTCGGGLDDEAACEHITGAFLKTLKGES